MFSHISAFFVDVADRWFFWIGLFLMVQPYLEGAFPRLAKILDRVWGHSKQRKLLFRSVGAAALLIACFQAWDTQYTQNQAVDPIDKRLAMKDLISAAIDQGEKIGENWSSKSPDSFEAETNEWSTRIGKLVEDAYGKGESSVVMSDAGYISYTDGKKQTNIHNWIIHRLQRLNDLMARIDSLKMRPDFDPKNYHWS